MGKPDADTCLVDGYNVIRRTPGLRAEEQEHDLAAGRNALVSRIQASPLLVRSQVIVVFDGASGSSAWAPVPRAGLEVRFSRPPQNADQAILSILRSRRDNSRIEVVTADGDLAWEVRKLGAQVVSPEEWITRLTPRRTRRQGAESGRYAKPEATRKEVEWGLKVFGEDRIEVDSENRTPALPSAAPARAAREQEYARRKERRRKRYQRSSGRRRR